MSQPLRVGFISASAIGRKIWQAVHDSGNVVYCVASRDQARTQAYIDELQAACPFPTKPLALPSYDAILADPNVECVYVPLPTATRADIVCRAAAAGKHIVCEKPVASNMEELQRMLDACKANKVLFMDGTMLTHGKRIYQMVEATKALGSVRHINGTFSFPGTSADIRWDPVLEPQGCIGDIGWYICRYTLHVSELQMPTEVRGRVLMRSPKGAVIAMSGELVFGNGLTRNPKEPNTPVTVNFFISFQACIQQAFSIVCEAGTVSVGDFCLPFTTTNPAQFIVSKHTITMEESTKLPFREINEVHRVEGEDPSYQETQLWRDIASASRDPNDAELEKWRTWAWKTQVLVEALLASGNQNGAVVKVSP